MLILKKNPQGFTVVELLIVIVVIAILAAMSVVAYTGIQNRANDTAVQSDLRNLANKIELYNAEQGVYPSSDATLSGLELKVSKGSYGTFLSQNVINVLYCHPLSSNNYKYAIIAKSKSGKVFQYGGSGTGLYSTTETSNSIPLCAGAGSPIPDSTDSSRTFLYDMGWKNYVGS